MRRKPLVIALIVTPIVLVIGLAVFVIIADSRLQREEYERCLVENGHYEVDEAGRDDAQIACTGLPDDYDPR